MKLCNDRHELLVIDTFIVTHLKVSTVIAAVEELSLRGQCCLKLTLPITGSHVFCHQHLCLKHLLVAILTTELWVVLLVWGSFSF